MRRSEPRVERVKVSGGSIRAANRHLGWVEAAPSEVRSGTQKLLTTISILVFKVPLQVTVVMVGSRWWEKLHEELPEGRGLSSTRSPVGRLSL